MFSNEKPKSSTNLVDLEVRTSKTTELATLALDKAGLVYDENEYFKKTCTRIESQLEETTRIDDDINIRCFLDSFCASKGFNKKGRASFFEKLF